MIFWYFYAEAVRYVINCEKMAFSLCSDVYFIQLVLSGQPVSSGHLAIPAGSTVVSSEAVKRNSCDKFRMTSRFILKQLGYSLTSNMRDS